jgi:segregation and condensation protein B
MDNVGEGYLERIIEALLFISEKPITLEQFKEVLGTVGINEIRAAIQELQKEYENQKRGIVVVEIAGGYQMLSSPSYVSYVRKFFKTRVKEKLSLPALEAMAIVAYKQPVSRSEIELIRGVNSDGVVLHLLNKGLIKIVGRKDVAGRPFIYGTTKLFLEYFGLKSLDDLPKLEALAALKKAEEGESGGPAVIAGSTGEIRSALIPLDLSSRDDQVSEQKEHREESAAEENPAELKEAMENLQKDKPEVKAEEADPMPEEPEAHCASANPLNQEESK